VSVGIKAKPSYLSRGIRRKSSSISHYSPLLSLEAGLALASTKTETALALGASSGVYNSLSSRTTSLSIYRLVGYLIYSNKEL